MMTLQLRTTLLALLTIGLLAAGCSNDVQNNVVPGKLADAGTPPEDTAPDDDASDTTGEDAPEPMDLVDDLPSPEDAEPDALEPDASAPDTGEGDTGPTDPLEACADALIPAAQWPQAERDEAWAGMIELGQTHIVRPNDERLAPKIVAERAALLLFTPDLPLEDTTEVVLGAWENGQQLGVLKMAPPEALASPLEADISAVALEPYSQEAWSADLPWQWVRPGVELRIGHLSQDTLKAHSHTLEGLTAPHRFTVTRTRMVLHGQEDFKPQVHPSEKIAGDYFAAVPFADLRWVDGQTWKLDAMVVRTPQGPRWAASEAERQALTPGEDHWAIFKHQFALRMSLANTGRGLTLTGESQGDSSPYSFGTSVGQGWFRDEQGRYRDIDDAPWAAGWTGWTAMWVDDCGNGFIHEVGHSMTLAHFTEGTANQWGIADQYPQDGVNLDAHPWGYDTVRRRLRTWYRVNANGPVQEGEALLGKRDPMNGGEPAIAATCFPQYTGYHGRKAQDWAVSSPTIAQIDGQPGIYRWNADTGQYDREEAEARFGEPIAVEVPVATLVGTLGNHEGTSQTYPPIFIPSGNAFTMPDPFGQDLPQEFHGAGWFLEIEYAQGPNRYALINRGHFDDNSLYLYSLNLPLEDAPTQIHLHRAQDTYPQITLEASEIVHTQEIGQPDGPFAPILETGHGALTNGDLQLTQRCQPGLNCNARRAQSTWRRNDGALHFGAPDQTQTPEVCTERGQHTTLRIPVLNERGEGAEVIVHAQRVLRSGTHEVAVPIHDTTPWLDAPDLEQSLRLWLPHEPNSALPSGRYQIDGAYALDILMDGQAMGRTALTIDLEVQETERIDIGQPYTSAPVSAEDSSMYFVVTDPSVGPTERVWWDNGEPGTGTTLRVPVLNTQTQQPHTLHLWAEHQVCDQSLFDFNAGEASRDCNHRVLLRLADQGNEGLQQGQTYQSAPSAPLIIEARRWHDPNGRALIQTFALDITHTP